MENAAESIVSQNTGFAAVERMRKYLLQYCHTHFASQLLVCQTEDFYLPFESELSISVGITTDFHVEGLFSTRVCIYLICFSKINSM